MDAITKLKAEINQEKNVHIQTIGDFLLQHLEKFPEDAAFILAEGKTIKSGLIEMGKFAHENGRCGVLSDEEGYTFVLAYFNIDAVATAVTIISTKRKTSQVNFKVKLQDLLNGGK